MKTKQKKISFLTKRKDINDKFFDLVKEHIKSVPILKGKQVGKWRKKGVKELAGELEISTGSLTRYIKRGSINKDNDQLFINVERNFEKLAKQKKKEKKEFSREKKTTKQYTIHTFTFNNFFKRKPFGKLTKNEQLYFRAGLHLVFRSGKKGFYTIQNLPISHHANKYPQGYKEFFDIIKIALLNYPSLLHFLFNYFEVQKINVATIEERLQKFNTTHSKTKKRKK